MSPACSALVTVQSLTELQKSVSYYVQSKISLFYSRKFIINLLHKKAGLINPFCTVYCAGILNFL